MPEVYTQLLSFGRHTLAEGVENGVKRVLILIDYAYGGGDVTAPVLSSPTGVKTGDTTATVGATTDEGNGVLFWVVTTSSTSPSAAQIIAGQNHLGAAANAVGNQAISSTGVKTANVASLASSTTFYAHLVHRDSSNNLSNVVTSASFTTDAASGGLIAPVLTLTSVTGTNPPDWSSYYEDAIVWDAGTSSGDKLNMRWRVNGGAWNNDTETPLTETVLVEGLIWPLFSAASPFAAGALIEVQEWVKRYVNGVLTGTSAFSNTLSDTMAAAAAIAWATTAGANRSAELTISGTGNLNALRNSTAGGANAFVRSDTAKSGKRAFQVTLNDASTFFIGFDTGATDFTSNLANPPGRLGSTGIDFTYGTWGNEVWHNAANLRSDGIITCASGDIILVEFEPASVSPGNDGVFTIKRDRGGTDITIGSYTHNISVPVYAVFGCGGALNIDGTAQFAATLATSLSSGVSPFDS